MEGSCCKCRKYIHPEDGIFCGNFWTEQGLFVPCKGCWCASCFTVDGTTNFFIRPEVDTDGIPLETKDSERRFKMARKGDHLLTPFQCPLCHFCNIQLRNPSPWNSKDTLAIEFIARACIDSSWARE